MFVVLFYSIFGCWKFFKTRSWEKKYKQLKFYRLHKTWQCNASRSRDEISLLDLERCLSSSYLRLLLSCCTVFWSLSLHSFKLCENPNF